MSRARSTLDIISANVGAPDAGGDDDAGVGVSLFGVGTAEAPVVVAGVTIPGAIVDGVRKCGICEMMAGGWWVVCGRSCIRVFLVFASDQSKFSVW